MSDTTKITCRRCKGRGFLPGYVVQQGVCFACEGAGEVYKDRFYRRFGVGRYFGISLVVKLQADNPNNGTFKWIDKTGDASANDGFRTFSAKEITEDQARRFYARYGDQRVKVTE